MTGPLRIGVVGAGAVAQIAHLPVLSRMVTSASVVALCDNDGPKARALAARFEIPDVYEDIEDLLRFARPDAVAVCTPNHLHEIHVKTALSAGVHVLCERPLGLSATGIQQVMEMQRSVGRVVLTGMNHRFRNDAQAVRIFVEGGELGRVHAVRSGWYTFRSTRQALGWRRRRAESGGGAMLDLGLPLIDLSLWAAGMPTPRRVAATVVRGVDEQSGVEDAGAALITCDGGLSILVDVSWHYVGRSERFRFSVQGDEGAASLSPLAVFKALHGAPVNVTPTGAAHRENVVMGSHSSQWASFVAMVRGDVEAPDLSEQLVLQRVLEAVYESAASGQTVEL